MKTSDIQSTNSKILTFLIYNNFSDIVLFVFFFHLHVLISIICILSFFIFFFFCKISIIAARLLLEFCFVKSLYSIGFGLLSPTQYLFLLISNPFCVFQSLESKTKNLSDKKNKIIIFNLNVSQTNSFNIITIY